MNKNIRMNKKITIIGSGNVGFHLAQQLFKCGHSICQVYSRKKEKAEILAELTNSKAINKVEHLSEVAEIYILAISDNALERMAEEISFLNNQKKIIVHTSGSVTSRIFESYFDNYGVFYPLQTFSMQKEANFEKLPFCIYGNSEDTEKKLVALARTICPNVFLADDKQRSIIHVTAVIVNNFSNYLYSIAHEICEDHNIAFDILKALIEETAKKVQEHRPDEIQTGPAIRGDNNTIERHLQFLSEYPEYQKIYRILSDGLSEKAKKL
jgi:predicted short-subunit dehydrogenase-like oxidoreductase (DUF2520 family)